MLLVPNEQHEGFRFGYSWARYRPAGRRRPTAATAASATTAHYMPISTGRNPHIAPSNQHCSRPYPFPAAVLGRRTGAEKITNNEPDRQRGTPPIPPQPHLHVQPHPPHDGRCYDESKRGRQDGHDCPESATSIATADHNHTISTMHELHYAMQLASHGPARVRSMFVGWECSVRHVEAKF